MAQVTMLDEITATDAFRNGDVNGFEWLATRYTSKVVRIARRFLRSTPDAEDLVHDALVKAWEQRARFSAGGRFEPWLCRIVMNLALDLIKHRRCIPFVSIDDTTPVPVNEAPDAIVSARLLSRRILTALDRLGRRQREVAVLSFLYGYKHSEIARMMSLAEPTVRSHVSLARKRLRAELSDGGMVNSLQPHA
jgi:RNA polymerase sigma factor (sigma-70 family)